MIDEDVLMLLPVYLARNDKALAPEVECSAWDAFHRECKALIFRLVRRVRAARAAIDDLAQDVWAAVLEGLPRFCLDPNRGALESWVRSLVSRRLWSYLRRRSRRRERPLAADLAAGMLDGNPGPEAELEQMQEHELFCARVTQFARRLSERDARIAIMRFIELKSAAAIARDIGVAPGCVRDFLHRAAPELRDFLLAGGIGSP